MWAYQLDAPCSFARRDVDRPSVSHPHDPDGMVLLRTLAGGVCGSDLPAFRGTLPVAVPPERRAAWTPPPGYPMHEVVGEVVAAPDHLFERGTRVVGWAAGVDAIAEYTLARTTEVAPYASGLSPTTAILLQPLACVIEALDHVPAVEGATVAVIGQGPIGVLFSHVLKARGAGRIVAVDRVDHSDVAEHFGVDEFVHSSSDRWAATVTDRDRPSIVVECVGHQATTLGDAVRSVAVDGTILYYGLPDEGMYPVDLLQLMRKRVNLVTRVTKDRSGSVVRADKFLAEHPELRDGYVTHRLPPDRVQAAFGLAVAPAAHQLKIVLDMQ